MKQDLVFNSNRPDLNYSGADWLRFEEWAAEALLDTYKKLASINIDEAETNRLRGRAALLTQLLDFRNIPAILR